MKKIRFLFMLLVSSILFSCFNVYAVETYERTPDDYRVPSDIVITSDKIDNIMSTPSVDASEKIYDFANLFTDSQESYLYSDALQFKNNYNLELVIVTIDDNASKNYRDYAVDFYDYNYFDVNGILLLIDMDSRNYYMSTTGSAIYAYSDSECIYIEDELYNYMASGNYYGAANKFISLANSYVSSNNDDTPALGEYDFSSENTFAGFLQVFGCSFVATVIVIVIMAFQNRMVKKATSSRNYLNNETKSIIAISDIFLGSNTTKVRINNDSSSSSGGGSRSSSFSGSSGRSHGGGRGRGF